MSFGEFLLLAASRSSRAGWSLSLSCGGGAVDADDRLVPLGEHGWRILHLCQAILAGAGGRELDFWQAFEVAVRTVELLEANEADEAVKKT
jgi:hypothetical protein